MKKVSLVVAVYNVDAYLDECLESIFSQDYPSLEVIAVNDGSTDRSREILVEHQQMGRPLMILDQKNSGHSVARNTGMRAASGEYIGFVDADDRIAPSMVRRCVEFAQAEDLEAVTFDVEPFGQHLIPGSQEVKKWKKTTKPGIYTDGSLFEHLLEDKGFWISVWLFFFSRSFLEKSELEFSRGLVHDDVEFTPRALAKLKSAGVMNTVFYYYRRDRNDAITSITSREKSEIELLATYNHLYKCSANDAYDANSKDQLERFLVQRYLMLISGAIGSNERAGLSRRSAIKIISSLLTKRRLRKRIALKDQSFIVVVHLLPEILTFLDFISKRLIGPVRRVTRYKVIPWLRRLGS